MKFRFLGGMDSPDWLLSQIAVSSKLSALKYRGMCQLIVEELIGKEIPEGAMDKYITDDIGRGKIPDVNEIKRILMSLRFIFQKASGYACASEDLESELVQLGLPPEHSKMLVRIYTNSQEVIRIRGVENLAKEPHFVLENIERPTNNDVILVGTRAGNQIGFSFGQNFNKFKDEMMKIGEILKKADEES